MGKQKKAGKVSAGLILYRVGPGGLEVLIAHMGGPLWAKKERGWSIPKGEIDPGEEPLETARREFVEEVGIEPPSGAPIHLGEITQKSGKRVLAWAIEGDLDPTRQVSVTCEIQWPPKSGRTIEIPEVDRVEWVAPSTARNLVIEAQGEFFERLEKLVSPG
ncbi:MAG: NUDIX domain-containing protein [Solirubrobacterales bacterium]|nr:NUDIX domain-containing protein [Solirubrobacterales bacterium]